MKDEKKTQKQKLPLNVELDDLVSFYQKNKKEFCDRCGNHKLSCTCEKKYGIGRENPSYRIGRENHFNYIPSAQVRENAGADLEFLVGAGTDYLSQAIESIKDKNYFAAFFALDNGQEYFQKMGLNTEAIYAGIALGLTKEMETSKSYGSSYGREEKASQNVYVQLINYCMNKAGSYFNGNSNGSDYAAGKNTNSNYQGSSKGSSNQSK